MLVTSLPGRQATARMRVWRALKGLGAAVLRDGVYLLPEGRSTLAVLQERAQEVRHAGGAAYVLKLNGLASQEEQAFRQLFDRSADYARLIEAIRAWRARLGGRGRHATAQRGLKRLRRQYEALRAIDYFPGPAAEQAGELLIEAEAALAAHLAPGGEPRAAPGGAIGRLDRQAYRGRTWATRARPWIDRLASAWLIKRFIDPRARFLWLKDPRRCPKSAVGFDFDGAAFTHVGSRVTFEVLAASFGLEEDRALVRLGTLVHYLDVGGAPLPEAEGVARILEGARRRCRSDDALLAEAMRLFDDLYAAYDEERAHRTK